MLLTWTLEDIQVVGTELIVQLDSASEVIGRSTLIELNYPKEIVDWAQKVTCMGSNSITEISISEGGLIDELGRV